MTWEEAFGPLPKPEPIAVKRPKNPKPPEPYDPQKQWVEIKRKLAPWMTEEQLRAAPEKTPALEIAQRRARLKGGFVPKVDPALLLAETKKLKEKSNTLNKSGGHDGRYQWVAAKETGRRRMAVEFPPCIWQRLSLSLTDLRNTNSGSRMRQPTSGLKSTLQMNWIRIVGCWRRPGRQRSVMELPCKFIFSKPMGILRKDFSACFHSRIPTGTA